jgi:hypothetical protein
MKNLVNESGLIEDRNLRNKLAERVGVLEKVKKLILIPQTELATVKQLAEYYEVGEEYIQTLYKENKEEFDSDGVTVKTHKDFSTVLTGQLKTAKGKATFVFDNGETFDISTRGIKVFPKRSVLRCGMMLQHSKIASEIRNQLLNIEEKAPVELKLQDINEEQKLMLEIGMAVASGNATAVAIATTNLIAFKNRHITQLEQTNKALANGILEWEDRSRINFAIRKLSQKIHTGYGTLWNELYKQLKNKYHMDLKARGKQPWIQYVEENEWENVIKSFSALCEYYKQEPSDMFCDLSVAEVQCNE